MADTTITKTVVAPAQGGRPDGDQSDYVQKVDVETHSTEHVTGDDKRTFTTETKTDKVTSGEYDTRFVTLIDGELDKRKEAEDARAMARNKNRLATLLGAVVIGMIITWMGQSRLIPAAIVPYTFVITILCDSAFTFYALKHKI
jgi:hypothetical protein